MSDSSHLLNSRIGFSTGALERGRFEVALEWMTSHHVRSIELSALRFDELEALVNSLDSLPLDGFSYVSFHAPSSFVRGVEERVVELLQPVFRRGWNVVVHPDIIYTPSRWKGFGEQLLIENMDRRKSIGRTADELDSLFKELPQARLCLDVAHARQLDTTLILLRQIIVRFAERIAELHISELDSSCRHQPLSRGAVNDYRKVASHLSDALPVIIESMLDGGREDLRMEEFHLAEKALMAE